MNVHALLIPILLAGFVGPGVQQVNASCMFVFLPVTLAYSRATMVNTSRKRFWSQAAVLLLALWVSMALAMLGMTRFFALGGFSAGGVLLTLGLTFAASLMNVVVLALDAACLDVLSGDRRSYTRGIQSHACELLRRLDDKLAVSIVGFPAMYAAAWWGMTCLGPNGSWGNIGYALTDWRSAVQMAAIGGLPMLNFLIAAWASAFEAAVLGPYMRARTAKFSSETPTADERSGLLSDTGDSTSAAGKQRGQRALCGMALAVIGVLAAGGIRGALWDSFYMRDLWRQAPPTVRVACVLGGEEGHVMADREPLSAARYFARAQREAQAGAKIILFPEVAVTVNDEQSEDDYLVQAAKFAREHGVYLGATYEYNGTHPRNMLALATPEGNIGFKYQKSHPVPLIDKGEAGPAEVYYVDTPYGRMGGAICFDYAFPRYIARAGDVDHNIDIMLQPSYVWGAFPYLMHRMDALRAVEQGFTLFSCTRFGYSGIVTPYNDDVALKLSQDHGTMAGELPIRPRLHTLYSQLGDWFAAVCSAVALTTAAVTVAALC